MSELTPTIELLLLEVFENTPPMEALGNALREAGFTVHPQLISSLEQLLTALIQKNWQLCLAYLQAGDQETLTAVSHIRQQSGVPVILLAKECNADLVAAGLAAGAYAVIPAQPASLLTLMVERALASVITQQTTTQLQQTLNDTLTTLTLLVDTSHEAIAYCKDGLFVYSNLAFTKIFGLPSLPLPPAIPLLNLIHNTNKNELKQFLFEMENDTSEKSIECRSLHQDGSDFTATWLFTPAVFAGEPCLQLRVRTTHTVAVAASLEVSNQQQGEQTPPKESSKVYDEGFINYLQNAMDNGHFQLKYQPIISLHGEIKEYYEVQLRLTNEQGRAIRPDNFFSTAYHAGLMEKIDHWVISKASKTLSDHRANGHSACFFIMLSGITLQDDSLITEISNALKLAALPAEALIFQITEEDATHHLKHAQHFMQKLQDLRIRTCLSHFKGNAASFNLLKQLNIDYIKLDGQLIQECSHGIQQSQSLLQNSIKMLRYQNKITIAPMVEDAKVLALLWQYGVNYTQGYYLQSPSGELDYNFSGHSEELS